MLRSMILATATFMLAAQTPAPEAAKPEASAPAASAPAAPAPAETAEAPAAPEAKAAKPAKKADPVLATIGKEVIRTSDFDLFLESALNQQQRMQVQFIPEARAQYQKQYLEYRALAAKARKEGLNKGPAFDRKMALMNMQVLVQALFERDGAALQEKAAIKDADVKAYFDSHPDKFRTPESFTARHILISTRADGDKKALTDEEAKAKADKVLAEVKGGKPFAEAAKEYSDDPGSKDKGGLYEDTPFGRFVPEFDQAVRTQTAGQVGAPVKTMFGYHLIQVEKVTPAAAQTFEQAKDEAREQATTERMEAVMQGYMDGAKNAVGFKPAGAPAPAAKPAAKAKKVVK